MIIVIARVEVDPADLPQIRPILDAMMRATWEESGCLSYSMAVESETDGVISIVERWQDEVALRAHFGTPHMAAFKAAVFGLFKSLDGTIYDVAGERPLKI